MVFIATVNSFTMVIVLFDLTVRVLTSRLKKTGNLSVAHVSFIRFLRLVFTKRRIRLLQKVNIAILTCASGVLILLGLLGSVSLDSYIPLIAILIVSVSVVVSVFNTPKQLMIAAGSALAVIAAAYSFEVVLWVKEFIEQAAGQG